MRRDVYQAIADPNRRAIIDLLAKEPLSLNGVAEHFPISRPAISKHIKILSECGLVEVHPQGRERICEVQMEKLEQVVSWIEQARQLWEGRLDRLDAYLKELKDEEKEP